MSNPFLVRTNIPTPKHYVRPHRGIFKGELMKWIEDISNDIKLRANKTPWYRPITRWKRRIVAEAYDNLARDILHNIG